MKPGVKNYKFDNQLVQVDENGVVKPIYTAPEQGGGKVDKGQIVSFTDPNNPMIERKYRIYANNKMVPIVEPNMSEPPVSPQTRTGNPTLQRKRMVME